jgi:hypothetical protein
MDSLVLVLFVIFMDEIRIIGLTSICSIDHVQITVIINSASRNSCEFSLSPSDGYYF